MVSWAAIVLASTLVVAAGTDKPIRMLQTDGLVFTTAFSPDNEVLATAGVKVEGDKAVGKVSLLDVRQGLLKRTLAGHQRPIHSLSFSPDGKLLASASGDKTVKVWDAQTGRLIRTHADHTDRVLSVAFSPKGTELASGSKDGTVILWNAETAAVVHTLRGSGSFALSSVAFSPDGKQLAAAGGIVEAGEIVRGEIKLWDATTGKPLHTIASPGGWVTCIAFARDGKTLVAGSVDKTITVWDIPSAAVRLTLSGHTGIVSSLAISSDGEKVVSGSADGTVCLWDMKKGNRLRTMTAHEGQVNAVTFSSDGKLIASGGDDKAVVLWRCE